MFESIGYKIDQALDDLAFGIARGLKQGVRNAKALKKAFKTVPVTYEDEKRELDRKDLAQRCCAYTID